MNMSVPAAARTCHGLEHDLNASRFEVRLGAKPPSSPTPVEVRALQDAAQRVEDLGTRAEPFGEAPTPGGITMNSCNRRCSPRARRRSGCSSSARAASTRLGPAAFNDARWRTGAGLRRRRGLRRPSTRRAARSRRGGSCWACRRARSSARPASAGRAPPYDRGRNLAVDCATALARPFRVARLVAVAQLERFTLTGRRPEGTAARPNAPPSSVTSTSTVGCRASRDSRVHAPS